MGVPTFASAPWTTRPIRQCAAELALCATAFAALTLVLVVAYDGAGAALRVGLACASAAGMVGIYARARRRPRC